jgi:TPR repeat protein
VTRNLSRAVELFRASAEQGYSLGQFELGLCLANETGIAQDHVESVKYYRVAADQGHSGAQCNFGFALEIGRGIPKHLPRGVLYYGYSVVLDDLCGACN